MNLDYFWELLRDVYRGMTTCYYDLVSAYDVFACFFKEYEAQRGELHPPLRRENIRQIVDKMPWFDDGKTAYIEPTDYPPIIESYFNTPYKNCDYRINHFFNGKVRQIRYAEVFALNPMPTVIDGEMSWLDREYARLKAEEGKK